MPLRRNNTRTFHRTLYAGQLEKIRLLKRDDDQAQGTVRALIIFQARRSAIMRTAEPVQGDMTANHSTAWHIPMSELRRVGVDHLNSADRIEQLEGEERGWFWQPESTTVIDEKLFRNHLTLVCLRVDPPK